MSTTDNMPQPNAMPPQDESDDGRLEDTQAALGPVVTINVHHHGRSIELTLPEDSSLAELSDFAAESLSVPISNQKWLITPKPGVIKPPFTNKDGFAIPLNSMSEKAKWTLMGASTQEVADIDKAAKQAHLQFHRRPGPIKAAKPARTRDWKRAKEDAEYTFHTIRPLPYFHNPDKAQRFLERLSDDPGIRASMRKHQFSVGMLTEMDPALHTTHESRTLGLNRNAGEVIELRLRTDANDGFRDYKVIRKTLCHELAHNVHGPHDRKFWDLCHAIEKEVDRDDWTRGGHRLTQDEFYNPNDGGADEEAYDHGGWCGGEYVLGKGDGHSSTPVTGDGRAMSRREILARAAEERTKKAKEAEKPS